MPPLNARHVRLLQDAADDFRQSAGWDDLWQRLHRHMGGFGIARLMYGIEAFPEANRSHNMFVYSYDPRFVQEKLTRGLFECDEYVRAAKVETEPVLWSDTTRLVDLSPQAKLSLDLDYDFGVVTGVTLPMRFNNDLGGSGLGCHAQGMSWGEFERVWAENQHPIRAIVHAFDSRVRDAHMKELFPLSRRERECLLWLAAGFQHTQIAHRLGTHPKTVEKQIQSLKRKLRAVNTTQAVAAALVFGLVTP